MLIDADNARPSVVEGLLAEAARHGVAGVRRIYGDWTTPNLAARKAVLLDHSIPPVQQFMAAFAPARRVLDRQSPELDARTYGYGKLGELLGRAPAIRDSRAAFEAALGPRHGRLRRRSSEVAA